MKTALDHPDDDSNQTLGPAVESIPPALTSWRVGATCDKCGAEAFVQVTFKSESSLTFCGHHYAEYEALIVSLGAFVIDDRTSIPA